MAMTSVVRGEEDDGVFGESEFVELRHDTSNIGVEVLNHRGIGGVVVTGAGGGLVTMEDVIETLLGLEIMDESDNIADLQSLARKNWETRAKATGVIEKPTSPDE